MTKVQGLVVLTNSTINRGVKHDGAFNGSSVLVVKVENWKELDNWKEIRWFSSLLVDCFMFNLAPLW
jgi:hypothetical protein